MARRDDIFQEILGTFIQSIWPEGRDILINGLDHYLNFGFTNGVNGYGIRDNNGIIEFKNSGGTWTPIGSGSGSPTPTTPPESPTGSGTTFTFASDPKYIVSDGVTYFEGFGYTYSGGVATMTVPPSEYIRGFI